MPDANEIAFGKKLVIELEIAEASAVNITADGFHAVVCDVESPEYVVEAVVDIPAVVKLPPVILPVAVIVDDAAIVVAPDIAPDEIVAVPSVNEPPVTAPEAVIATAPVTVPSDDINAPSVIAPAVVKLPPVILPVAVIVVPAVTLVPTLANPAVIILPPVMFPVAVATPAVITLPPVMLPVATTCAPVFKLPPTTLPATVIAGVVILAVLIVVALDASDVAEKSCIVPDAFTLTCDVPLARTEPDVVEFPFNIAFVESSVLKISNVFDTSLNINEPTCNTLPCTSLNLTVSDPKFVVTFAVGIMFPETVELIVSTPCASIGPANSIDPVPAGSILTLPFEFVDAIVFDAT